MIACIYCTPQRSTSCVVARYGALLWLEIMSHHHREVETTQLVAVAWKWTKIMPQVVNKILRIEIRNLNYCYNVVCVRNLSKLQGDLPNLIHKLHLHYFYVTPNVKGYNSGSIVLNLTWQFSYSTLKLTIIPFDSQFNLKFKIIHYSSRVWNLPGKSHDQNLKFLLCQNLISNQLQTFSVCS